MKTKTEAEEVLKLCNLRHGVSVEDVTGEQGEPRRRFVFPNANGKGEVTIEVDADPTPAQLESLAMNLGHGEKVDGDRIHAVLKASQLARGRSK